jgi:hypothetical protein
VGGGVGLGRRPPLAYVDPLQIKSNPVVSTKQVFVPDIVVLYTSPRHRSRFGKSNNLVTFRHVALPPEVGEKNENDTAQAGAKKEQLTGSSPRTDLIAFAVK